jgi:tetratricopeptide (TPR) repeat protein
MKISYFILVVILSTGMSGYGLAQRGASPYASYTDNIAVLERELASASRQRLGDIYARLASEHYNAAELYNEISFASAATGNLYYALMDENDWDAGNVSSLFRGICYHELGKTAEAISTLESFVSSSGRIDARAETTARAWLGIAYHSSGQTERAADQWRRIESEERDRCGILAFAYAKVGYRTETAANWCGNGSADGNDRASIIPALQVATVREQHEQVKSLLGGYRVAPSHVENRGMETEIRFYDPATIRTVSNAHYLLAYRYASQAVESGATEANKDLYRSAFYFYTGQFGKVIETQVGRDDVYGALYLGAAYYAAGEPDVAREVFRYIERSNDHDVLSKLGLLYARLGVAGKERQAVEFAEQAVRDSRDRSGRMIRQDRYRRLGEIYILQGEYDRAIEVLGSAFRSERRDDLRANDPQYLIMYGTSIVLGKNFIALSEAIDMFSTVMRAYPVATALVETTSLLDVATNIGREGRVIYRR